MSLSAFELSVHGAACGLFLLLAGLTWRDRRQTRSAPWGGAHARRGRIFRQLDSGIRTGWSFWRVPVLALAAGSPAVFWLWARVVFDDDFILRAQHAGLWALLVTGELVSAYGGATWSGSGPVADTLVQLAALGLAVLAAAQNSDVAW